MPPYHDVYVLSPERSPQAAYRFLAAFAPHGKPSRGEYSFPQYSQQPAAVFESADEALQYCIQYPCEPQSLYYCNPGGAYAHAMLFFTSDGGLILGLSVEDGEEEAFERLQEHAGSSVGYITVESPPCETIDEFRQFAEYHLMRYRAAKATDN